MLTSKTYFSGNHLGSAISKSKPIVYTKYQACLVFKWLREVGCQLVWYSNAIEYQTNGRHLVVFCTGPLFKWLVKYMRHSP